MPRYYVETDERYPDYDLYGAKQYSFHNEYVELTEEEAKAFTASQILYDYWQEFVGKRIQHEGR